MKKNFSRMCWNRLGLDFHEVRHLEPTWALKTGEVCAARSAYKRRTTRVSTTLAEAEPLQDEPVEETEPDSPATPSVPVKRRSLKKKTLKRRRSSMQKGEEDEVPT